MNNDYQLTLKNHEFDHANIMVYPDGQRQVKLDLDYFKSAKYKVTIKCQIKSFQDLELLSAAVSALKWNDFLIDKINFAYLFGARSDRLFNKEEANYFRDVIAPILNSYNCEMSFLDLHGRCGDFLNSAIRGYHYPDNLSHIVENKIILAGDESAIEITDNFFEYDDDKSWEENSKIVQQMAFIKKRIDREIEVHLDLEPWHNIAQDKRDTIIIMDDLCDGGATFIAEAKYLRNHFPSKKLHLYVTHGLFSKGIEELCCYFDKIYTTNSYQDFPQNPNDPFKVSDKLEVIQVI